MPINAPPYYYILAERYREARDIQEKEKILIEMIKVLPKHKGSERELASLKRRLSLLRKSKIDHKKLSKRPTIKKLWPRICLIGYDYNDISNFKLVKIEDIYHGIIEVKNIHVQIVSINDVNKDKEIFDQSDIIISKQNLDTNKNYIIMEKPDIPLALEKYGIISVFTQDSNDGIAMKEGDTIMDLAKKLHMNLSKGAYAIIYGKGIKFQGQRVGVNYKLKDGDRVFIKL